MKQKGPAKTSRRRPRLCLAGSGGGHVRQLLDLEPVWSAHDHFFVTEDTALGQSLKARARVHFVSHVALGQGRLGAPLRMILSGLRNLAKSAAVIGRERPDIVITTGAGSMFFSVLWARLLGARIVLVEVVRKVRGAFGLRPPRRTAGARQGGPVGRARFVVAGRGCF